MAGKMAADAVGTGTGTRTAVQAAAGPLPRASLFSKRSWAELLYLAIDFPLALATFVTAVVLVTVGAGLAVVYVGVAVLMGGLLLARALGGLRRGMAGPLLGLRIAPPGPRRPRRSGFVGAVAGMLAEPTSWRAFAYHCIRLCAAPLSLVALVLWFCGIGALTYPAWRDYLPAQLGRDGVWHRAASFGPYFFLDTLPRMIMVFGIGVVLLWTVPLLVRALANIDRRMIARMLG